jgi:hypothetical protein
LLKSGSRKGNHFCKDGGDYYCQHLPDQLKDKTCSAKFKSYARKGLPCGCKIKYYRDFCGIHNH